MVVYVQWPKRGKVALAKIINNYNNNQMMAISEENTDDDIFSECKMHCHDASTVWLLPECCYAITNVF